MTARIRPDDEHGREISSGVADLSELTLASVALCRREVECAVRVASEHELHPASAEAALTVEQDEMRTRFPIVARRRVHDSHVDRKVVRRDSASPTGCVGDASRFCVAPCDAHASAASAAVSNSLTRQQPRVAARLSREPS